MEVRGPWSENRLGPKGTLDCVPDGNLNQLIPLVNMEHTNSFLSIMQRHRKHVYSQVSSSVFPPANCA